MPERPAHRTLLASPSAQILVAILAGVLLGALAPAQAIKLRFIGEYFVDVLRLFVGPVIFCTVALGIASMRSKGELGAAALAGLVYFEAMALLSLLAGVAGAWLFQPGSGLHLAAALPGPAPPASLLGALAHTARTSAALQLLGAGIVCGLLLARSDARMLERLALVSTALLRIVGLLLKAAPLAAFAAIALTVGKYGIGSLAPLLKLLGALYASTALFVLLVLGAVLRCCGASLWRLVVYLRAELLLVFGTAASVACLAALIGKLTRLGCQGTLVNVLLPAGFSFNLNGSNIYLTLTLLFLAQAAQLAIEPAQLGTILVVAMIASKGASGIAGSSFVILGSLAALVPGIAPESLVLVFSLERLLKCRSLANVLGNAVACIAILTWMGKIDRSTMRHTLGMQKQADLTPV